MEIKDKYIINLLTDGSSVLARSQYPNFEEMTFPDKPYKLDWRKKYRFKVGDKVINPWGAIETISEVIFHEETETINYLVEENGNCYQARELAGIYVKHLSKEETDKLINA